MRITPLDVRKQEFRKVVRGLDPEEVYAFLATVADEYEVVLTDNKQLREQNVGLDERVKEYRNMETALRDTMMTAERVTNETKTNAEKEASLILEKARVEAERETASISSRVESLRHQLRELKTQRDAYLTRLRTLSETQLNLLGNYERDFAGDDQSAKEALARADREAAASQIAPATSAPATPAAPAPSPAPAPPTPPTQAAPSTPPTSPTPSAPAPAPSGPNPVPSASPTPAAAGPAVEDQPTKPIPTFAGVPMSEDTWRDYDVGETQTDVPDSAPSGPVNTMVDSLPNPGSPEPTVLNTSVDAATDLAQAVEDAASGGFAPSGQPTESVAPSSPHPSGSGDVPPGTPPSSGDSGWSMQRFTSGLQG